MHGSENVKYTFMHLRALFV